MEEKGSYFIRELLKGIVMFSCGNLEFMGYHPLVPACFAVCSMEGRASLPVLLGAVYSCFHFMVPPSLVRYLFVLLLIGIAIRFFVWTNQSCDSFAAALIAGCSAIGMNLVGVPFQLGHKDQLYMSILEGVMIFGFTLAFHGVFLIPFQFRYFVQKERVKPFKMATCGVSGLEKMESLSCAVSGLSDMLFSLSMPKTDENVAEPDRNYNELLENRYIIAKQFEAMADLIKGWTKLRLSSDEKYGFELSKIVYGAKEKGLIIEDLHIYTEEDYICIEGFVSTRWSGGVPVKTLVQIVEKVFGKSMRVGKEVKNIMSKDASFVVIYEDTALYGLQGIATEKKNGSKLNGDSFSFFSMDDGNYHICLSDGMGSGRKANQESELMIELLQKLIEAGFQKEIAIKMMNSAFVLQGNEESYPTLDYACINMYNGELEIIKIGGATSFIKRGEEVECIEEGSLPAGASLQLEMKTIKRELRHGEFLVLVTDGMIEYLHVRNPKESLADIIAMAKGDNAGAIAQYIMEQVLIRTGGYAMDDMTVLVTGIWEK